MEARAVGGRQAATMACAVHSMRMHGVRSRACLHDGAVAEVALNPVGRCALLRAPVKAKQVG